MCLLLDQQVIVKWNPKIKNHYVSLGYSYTKMGDFFQVSAFDLTKGSNVIVSVQCDYCKRVVEKIYNCLRQERENSTIGKDCCIECQQIKTKDSNLINYGVESTSQLDEIKEKIRETNLMKYGYEYPSLIPFVLEKRKKTNLLRRGVECPFQDPKVKEKIMQSYFKNGTCRTSSQQLKVFETLKENGFEVELNYPINEINLDIALFYKDSKIDIEYDGKYWHQDNLKDRRRDEFLKEQGWKVLRIKSGRLIPNLADLLSSINELSNSKKKYKSLILDDWDTNVS
jgi:very-short-patch-repair endonuclease